MKSMSQIDETGIGKQTEGLIEYRRFPGKAGLNNENRKLGDTVTTLDTRIQTLLHGPGELPQEIKRLMKENEALRAELAEKERLANRDTGLLAQELAVLKSANESSESDLNAQLDDATALAASLEKQLADTEAELALAKKQMWRALKRNEELNTRVKVEQGYVPTNNNY